MVCLQYNLRRFILLSKATQILFLPHADLPQEQRDLLFGTWESRSDKYCNYLKKTHRGWPKHSTEMFQEKTNYLIHKHKHFSDPEVGSDVSCLKVTLKKKNSWKKREANIWQV